MEGSISSETAIQLAQEIHSSMGHSGRYKTYHLLKDICEFRNMHRITAEVVKNYGTCQINKPINFVPGNWTSHKPQRILETVSLDLMGPLMTRRREMNYILIILDVFSKYIRLKKATTKEIIDRIEKDYIPKVVTPESVLPDNGIQFTSVAWKKILEELQIKKKAYHKISSTGKPRGKVQPRDQQTATKIL